MASWQELAASHRNKRDAAIPREWVLPQDRLSQLSGAGTDGEGRLILLESIRRSGLLTDEEFAITEHHNATSLLRKISGNVLSSEAVTVAFCKRAALAQQLTSCLTEVFFQEAIDRAKWLDQYLQDNKTAVGPLHGLPISLKASDSFQVKGHHATLGYTASVSRQPSVENSALVQLLLDAGAVLYCKTNIPQTLMTADSENNIFGRTLNPHKTSLTAGGSSGGEGALVASRGSPLGVGTDIAGSIRIPSLCCGTYGFKPTSSRVPYGNQVPAPFTKMRFPGGITPCAGPLANSMEDLDLFMSTVIGKRPWKYDPTALDIDWRKIDFGHTKKLTVGVLAEDPEYPLMPPVKRALDEAVALLVQAGHNIVFLPADEASSPGLGGRLAGQFYGLAPSGYESKEEVTGEPKVKSVALGVHPYGKAGFPVDPELDLAHRVDSLAIARDDFARAWQHHWCDRDLDVVVAPGCNTTAVPYDTYGVPVYTMMWNLLDYPAGIIPFGKSSKAMDPNPRQAEGQFEADYNPDAWDGAPCAIQIIAPRFRDEECLAAMRIIDKDLNKS
ncbi:hypothetical protein JX266_010898 [Neoarthrinium moseri]|nr:hypothetical protein JX266_010898 [Neoarthrinium moseri]